MTGRVLFWLIAALAFSGCRIERHFISPPGVSQTLRADSGDRFYTDLEEDTASGFRWEAVCRDPDVEVKMEHAPGKAEVEIRFHRGYDGPTNVEFSYRRPGDKTPTKKFTLAFYKRTGDCAFWE